MVPQVSILEVVPQSCNPSSAFLQYDSNMSPTNPKVPLYGFYIRGPLHHSEILESVATCYFFLEVDDVLFQRPCISPNNQLWHRQIKCLSYWIWILCGGTVFSVSFRMSKMRGFEALQVASVFWGCCHLSKNHLSPKASRLASQNANYMRCLAFNNSLRPSLLRFGIPIVWAPFDFLSISTITEGYR